MGWGWDAQAGNFMSGLGVIMRAMLCFAGTELGSGHWEKLLEDWETDNGLAWREELDPFRHLWIMALCTILAASFAPDRRGLTPTLRDSARLPAHSLSPSTHLLSSFIHQLRLKFHKRKCNIRPSIRATTHWPYHDNARE